MLVHFWSLSVTQRYALGTLPSLALSDSKRTGLAYIDMVSVEWKRVPPGTLYFIITIILFLFFFFSLWLWIHWWATSRAGMLPSCCRLTRVLPLCDYRQKRRDDCFHLWCQVVKRFTEGKKLSSCNNDSKTNKIHNWVEMLQKHSNSVPKACSLMRKRYLWIKQDNAKPGTLNIEFFNIPCIAK